MNSSTQAVALFDLHSVGLLRLGLASVKSRLSIGPWQSRGPVLRLGKGSSKLYPSTGSSHQWGFVLRLAWKSAYGETFWFCLVVLLPSSTGDWKQWGNAFRLSLESVKACFSFGPRSQHGFPPGCLFRLTWRKRVESRSFISYFLFPVSFISSIKGQHGLRPC